MDKRFALCVALACASAISTLTAGCSSESPAQAASSDSAASTPRKLGVLLVNHGSRSARWREMLLSVEKSVRKDVLALDKVERITTAFMEYTEPSIATRLEEFDRDGFTDVIIVPLLLTVSSHSFDDIPTICGQQQNVVARERLRADGIAIYKPRANVHITALLDFPDILGRNVLRRVRALSEDASDEGVLLVGYGSADYEEAWARLLDDRLGALLKQEMGVPECTHCWCGHLVHYDPEVTQRAIEDILTRRKRVLVVPVLVAVDEMFQEGIIQQGIDKTNQKSRVRYVPDAILPDAGVRQWVVEAARGAQADILGRVAS
jgi:sirohydrochlorin ferrochelatase